MGSRNSKFAISRPVDVRAVIPGDPEEHWENIYERQAFEPPEIHVGQKKDIQEGKIVRFVCLSDTHGKHRDCAVPYGDVILHAGDITNIGEFEQLQDFEEWLSGLPHEHKVVIAGNHDITTQPEYYNETGRRKFHDGTNMSYDPEECKRILTESSDILYLEDSGIKVEGISIWGSPWQPVFGNWAFNLPRGEIIKAKWDKIPTSADVVITHGPPLGRLDANGWGHHTGCADLLDTIQQRVKPVAHVFGHIHEGHGTSSDGETLFVNASNCTINYLCTNPAIVFDIEVDANERIKSVQVVRSRVINWSTDEVKVWVTKLRTESTYPSIVYEVLEGLSGEELLQVDNDFINLHFKRAREYFQDRTARVNFIKTIRQLEVDNM
mmetsp:Transcript_2542/g.2869  ORF Transcript_2542/g.2869 Transcript_2542/m.2869 type:complete len:380 (-) Transcript_2542:516-1655(-)